jgi:hypothetical protein
MRIAAIIRILLDTDHLIYGAKDILGSAVYDIPIGIIACLPSFVLFGLTAYFLSKRSSTVLVKRMILTLPALVLSILPFAIVFPYQLSHTNYLPDLLPDLSGYSVVTLAGLWLYRFPSLSMRVTIT